MRTAAARCCAAAHLGTEPSVDGRTHAPLQHTVHLEPEPAEPSDNVMEDAPSAARAEQTIELVGVDRPVKLRAFRAGARAQVGPHTLISASYASYSSGSSALSSASRRFGDA